MSWNIGQRLGKIVAVVVSASLGTYVLAIALGIALVAFASLGGQLLGSVRVAPIELFLGLVVIGVPTNLLAVTVFSMAVYILCFVLALRQREGFTRDIKSLLGGLLPRRRTNWLIVMPLLASTLLVIVVAITFLQDLAGVSSGSLYNPSNPPPDSDLFASLAYAPVAEEIGFRLSALGLIFVLPRILFHQRPAEDPGVHRPIARAALLSLVSPDNGKRLAGLSNVRDDGLIGISWFEWIGLAITSAVFGIAHLLGGADWGIGKVTTAALSGLALGLAYLIYGVYASILLHWFFDFYTGVFLISADFFGNNLLLFDGLLSIFIIAAGIIGLTLVAVLFLFKRKTGAVTGDPPSVFPQAYPT